MAAGAHWCGRRALKKGYPVRYNAYVFTVQQTETFQDWLDGLRDLRAQIRITARLRLAEAGNLGSLRGCGAGFWLRFATDSDWGRIFGGAHQGQEARLVAGGRGSSLDGASSGRAQPWPMRSSYPASGALCSAMGMQDCVLGASPRPETWSTWE